ncbi:PREDICTED: deoxycytidylate deaminase isoform X1 [Papilio polytes]|uniref:deoxycytidylate deaminase isoform X1 n=2 Tax=Papilio polytes TaxID=76194 RepID=UPI00067675C5|nr:PREDICTED: deoxycytidylate deaminase isoform X1 [Papilio polytes]
MDLTKEIKNLSINDISSQSKRSDYIDWQEYFMATAILASKRSKDPSLQVGACVVNRDNKIVGIGYNGMPIGCDDDEFPWGKNTPSPLDSKYMYVCHAEMNAIVNKNSADVKDCVIYVGLFPCNECAKIIIQSGITEVVYLSDKKKHKAAYIASKRMFEAAGIKYWQYKPKNDKIIINFKDIDWESMSPSK